MFYHPLLQGIPRIWCPALACPQCSYPNDFSFNSCQRCGFHRHPRPAGKANPQLLSLDLPAIDARIQELDRARASTSYEKQKAHLELELEHFLESLPSPQTLLTASPKDVIRFLVWKDSKGKTKVHKEGCRFIGQQGSLSCNCPCRLAAGTVDSTIGKLRSIFSRNGRSGEWGNHSNNGNPAAHHSVKNYLKAVQQEQAQARISPKQAAPMFFDKFFRIVTHIRSLLQGPQISPIERYIFSRDLAFFVLSFSSGDRASDLGRVKTVDVLRNPDGKNVLIHQRIGKTLRGKRTRVFPVRQCENPAICPVRNLEFYMELCKASGMSLQSGYLFRPTSRSGKILDAPFLAPSVQARLTLYLDAMGANDGESTHSFRGGTAILLANVGQIWCSIFAHTFAYAGKGRGKFLINLPLLCHTSEHMGKYVIYLPLV